MCIPGDTIKLDQFNKNRVDDLLSKGYFRSGKSMFYCPVTFLDGSANTTIRTRLQLSKHQFGKSARKLLKTNNKKFSYRFSPLVLDQEIYNLYDLYKKYCFKGELTGELEDWLMGSFEKEIFDTKMCKIYDDKQLVAISFLDIGQQAVASIMGIYHPDYKKNSLGIYSMLLEVEYAKRLGMEYYYPGYLLSQSKRFEYKKKVGPLEFIRLSNSEWTPLKEIDYNDYFVEKSLDELIKLKEYLSKFKIGSELYNYPLYSWVSYPLNSELLEDYFFLKVELPGYETLFLAITYHPINELFQIKLVNSLGESSPTWQEFLNFYPEKGNWLDTILVQQSGGQLKTTQSIPFTILQIMDRLSKDPEQDSGEPI